MKTAFVHIITVAIIGLSFFACSYDTDNYAGIVAEWQGREIVFPEAMTDVITGDNITVIDADFTILTYIDSAGCTACRMKLSLWKEFLGALDSISDEVDVNAVIVVNTEDESELAYVIKMEDYTYPVVNDVEDVLNSSNRFPNNPMVRTFLLDRHKYVLAIGCPIYNNAVADLYRSIISGRKTFSVSGKQMIVADNSKVRIGKIPLGKEYLSDFSLSNESSDTVCVRNIISSCHCTEAVTPDTVIPPGEKLPVRITFREDSVTGDFIRTVSIFYYGFENPTVLEIHGTVIE
ncbi:MAG: DUF1573 domain-containing protein [Duncaniella sp.]|nr:DUF1573 domain-containing protein [Duncaniella sp.]